jgi:hypothetical protein
MYVLNGCSLTNFVVQDVALIMGLLAVEQTSALQSNGHATCFAVFIHTQSLIKILFVHLVGCLVAW